MKRATPLPLSEDEQTHIEVFVRQGKANVRSLTRARVLLKKGLVYCICCVFQVYSL